MSLAAGCPRCPTPVSRTGRSGGWVCAQHGEIRPLWRPPRVSYAGFVDHLAMADGFPTYLPWPLPPGWQVTGFGVVADEDRTAATVTRTSGASELDGPVEAIVVAEEPGVGLGGRLAGLPGDDPGPHLGTGSPPTRLRLGSKPVPLWPVSVAAPVGEWDRSVVAGESEGRWLWLILRPASALLLLGEDWILRDAARLGPALVEVPFGEGDGPSWLGPMP